VALLGVVNWLAIYGGDQNLVQRYVSARSTREAQKATLLYSAIALPMWTFFFFVGTCLFAFYQVFPDDLVSTLEADQVLPHFILSHIPAGLAGLVIAAVMAAAMSTLDSSINAIAAVSVVDLLGPLATARRGDRYRLRLAQVVSMGASALMILGALLFARLPKESMNDVSLIATSVFGGCLMGLFMVGFFTRRVDGTSANLALGAAVVFNVYLGLGALGALPDSVAFPAHSYWVGFLVNAAFILAAYVLSLARRTPPGDLEGLTVWTMSGARAADRS
jgi:SSS family solute:Na+ symporter